MSLARRYGCCQSAVGNYYNGSFTTRFGELRQNFQNMLNTSAKLPIIVLSKRMQASAGLIRWSCIKIDNRPGSAFSFALIPTVLALVPPSWHCRCGLALLTIKYRFRSSSVITVLIGELNIKLAS